MDHEDRFHLRINVLCLGGHRGWFFDKEAPPLAPAFVCSCDGGSGLLYDGFRFFNRYFGTFFLGRRGRRGDFLDAAMALGLSVPPPENGLCRGEREPGEDCG